MRMVLSLLLSVGICPWTAVGSWWWWWWWGGWQSRIGRYRASCLSLVSPCKCFQRTWLEPASALHLQSIDDFGPELLADFQYKCLQWLTLTGDFFFNMFCLMWCLHRIWFRVLSMPGVLLSPGGGPGLPQGSLWQNKEAESNFSLDLAPPIPPQVSDNDIGDDGQVDVNCWNLQGCLQERRCSRRTRPTSEPWWRCVPEPNIREWIGELQTSLGGQCIV